MIWFPFTVISCRRGLRSPVCLIAIIHQITPQATNLQSRPKKPRQTARLIVLLAVAVTAVAPVLVTSR
jgi:hypothetical protein